MGEEVNVKLRQYVVGAFTQTAIEAVAPALLSDFGMRNSTDYVYASNWSERHMAHAAGLGTFGLCDGLITAKGKAMRVGSVVARIKLPPTPRPYETLVWSLTVSLPFKRTRRQSRPRSTSFQRGGAASLRGWTQIVTVAMLTSWPSLILRSMSSASNWRGRRKPEKRTDAPLVYGETLSPS